MLLPEKLYTKYMELYPYTRHYMEIFRNDKGTDLPDWSDWCYLPVAAYYSIVEDMAVKSGIPIETLGIDIPNLAAISIWGVSKGVYRFDETLLKSLWATPLDKTLPIDLFFQLPEWCCYIDLENFKEIEEKGFFVYLENDVNTGDKELRIILALDNGGLLPIILHLRKEGIKASLKETFKYSENNFNGLFDNLKLDDDSLSGCSKRIEPFISLILYLCTVNADTLNPVTLEKPKRPKIIKKNNKEKIKVAKKVKEYRVGGQIGAAIRRANKPSLNQTKRTITPHIRRSHFHSFWTGSKDNKKLVVKWMSPIPINLNGEDIIPVVRKVKSDKEKI